jgi:PAS domain S-box-containing protein
MPRDEGRAFARLTNLSLGTKGVLVVSLPVIALLMAMVVFYQFERQLERAEAAVEQSIEVRAALRRVLVSMVSAETGIRGYMLTGKPEFLVHYRTAETDLPEIFKGLETSLSPEQKERLAQVMATSAVLLKAFEDSREDTAAHRQAEAQAHLQDDKTNMDVLRASLNAMQDRQQETLAQRTGEAKAAQIRLRAAIFAGGALGLLGGIIAVLIFTNDIAKRVRRLESEALQVASGQTIAEEVRGSDELARLEQTLKDTSETIARQSEELLSAKNALEARVALRTAELGAAYEELREANEVREGVIHSSPLAIWAIDLEGMVSFWNPAAEAIFGWKQEEVVGKPLPVVPADQAEEYARWLQNFRRGEMVNGVERRRQQKDGSLIDVAIWTAPLRDRAGNARGTIAIDTDISQRKLLEDQVRQAQKLEAVGRLAGGVAHDFNNLLTIIQGYTEMILMEAEEAPTLLEYAQEIQYASERASALTGQLLAFSRRQISQPKVLDVNDVVAHSMRMLRRIIGEDIEIESRLGPDLGKVKVDPVHLDQVIMNLAVNSRDAMPNGGRIVLETSNCRIDAEYSDWHIGVEPGAYVMLAVSDNGTGMTAETRSRIFEPFFTTKEAGKGTGLGLAIVYGVVKQANGEIIVYSEPGKGTTFKIYLPTVDQPASSAALEHAAAKRGSGTVLLCEDDAKIRRLVEAMLTRQGYRVLVAENPDQALETALRLDKPIDLLLTDIVMPRISGIELAKAVREARPGIRVLYMSGYTDSQMNNSWMVDEDVPFLQKPFTTAALAQKVQEALAGAETGTG